MGEKQKTFNIDNGLRVHERGKTDSFFNNITLLVFVVGSVEWCRVVFKMAYPNGLVWNIPLRWPIPMASCRSFLGSQDVLRMVYPNGLNSCRLFLGRVYLSKSWPISIGWSRV